MLPELVKSKENIDVFLSAIRDIAARKQDYLSSPNRSEIKIYVFSQNSSLLKANVILGLSVDAP